MALVKKLTPMPLDRNTFHGEVECTYSIVVGVKGEKLLQVDTYGSKQRQEVGKKSQSIRFSREALEQLKHIINEL